jgi:hypothetical protein
MREKTLTVPKKTIDKWVLALHHSKISIKTLHEYTFLPSKVTVHNAINHGIATQTTIDKLNNYFQSLNTKK